MLVTIFVESRNVYITECPDSPKAICRTPVLISTARRLCKAMSCWQFAQFDKMAKRSFPKRKKCTFKTISSSNWRNSARREFRRLNYVKISVKLAIHLWKLKIISLPKRSTLWQRLPGNKNSNWRRHPILGLVSVHIPKYFFLYLWLTYLSFWLFNSKANVNK